MSSYTDHGARQADLLLRQGDIAAQGQANKWRFIGNSLSSLASLPLAVEQKRTEQQMAARKAEREALQDEVTRTDLEGKRSQQEREKQIQAAMSLPTPIERVHAVGKIDPERAQKLEDAYRSQGFAYLQATTPQNYATLKPRIESIVGPGMLPESFATPEEFQAWKRQTLIEALPPKDYVTATKPDDPPADYTLGNQRFSGKTNQPIATGTPSQSQAPNVGSFEDYVIRRFGDAPTAHQITQARKDYQQADDRPPVNIRMDNGMTPGQAFAATRQLRNDYTRETQAARTVQEQLALMKSSLDAVKKGSMAAGSQGVLVTFQKILDPTSVVRESEYARSSSGMSLMSRIEGKWAQISQGGAGVTAKDLEQFVTLSEQFAKNQKAFADQSRSQIDSIAKEYGLKPENITRDVNVEQSAPAGGQNIGRFQVVVE